MSQFSERNNRTRRRFLQLGTASIGVASAGCLGDLNNDDSEGSGGGDDDEGAGANDSSDEETLPVNAGVDVTKEGTDVTVQITDIGNADGMVVTDQDGLPVGESPEVLTKTGASHTYSLSSSEGYIVYGIRGGTAVTGTDPIEAQVSSATVIADGEL